MTLWIPMSGSAGGTMTVLHFLGELTESIWTQVVLLLHADTCLLIECKTDFWITPRLNTSSFWHFVMVLQHF